MKLLAPFALATALIAAVPYSGESQPKSKTVNVDRVKASLVQISIGRADGQEGFCTGFVIDPAGRVATAEHCTEDAEWIKIDGVDTHVLKTKGWVSILDGVSREKPPLQFAKRKPAVLESVWVFGNANGWGFFVLERKIAAILTPVDAGHDDIFVDGPIQQGQSGGPIVNADGEVVAINQMTFGALGMGCDYTTVLDALK